ncbi:hypothetical protein HAX54_043528 [Datura stramonium]|uniref:Uncharacterized protein n=1 Tax=Datura stramonium TaxID=4076 RepID=A0ABS8SNI4_DATST|nr:hypothetical protein [Datura stramonium]
MASNWYVMFVFALVLVHVVSARNIPQVAKPKEPETLQAQVQTQGVTVNTEVTSTAPTPSEGLDDQKNFISFGGVGAWAGIGGYGGVLPTFGGIGGGGGGIGGLGGLGGLGGAAGGGIGGAGGLGVGGGGGGGGGLGVGGGVGGIGGIGGIKP